MELARTVHCKQDHYDVYFGRPSKWGNPFAISRDRSRKEVIEKYRKWFLAQTNLLDSVRELQGKVLGCFCFPKRCHGDILAFYANNPKRLQEDRKDGEENET